MRSGKEISLSPSKSDSTELGDLYLLRFAGQGIVCGYGRVV